jgi:hypothetical protein
MLKCSIVLLDPNLLRKVVIARVLQVGDFVVAPTVGYIHPRGYGGRLMKAVGLARPVFSRRQA